jgi:hypothetical protein
MRSAVNDRLFKVDKDLDVISKMFARHDERQGKAKQQKLAKGAAFF